MKDTVSSARSPKKAKANGKSSSASNLAISPVRQTITKYFSPVKQNGNNVSPKGAKNDGTRNGTKSDDFKTSNNLKRAKLSGEIKSLDAQPPVPRQRGRPPKIPRTGVEGCKTASPSKKSKKSKSQRKGGSNKTSPELRPRRRASQTYFFKYQLARNPLKAEEEELKKALLASLEQCDNSNSSSAVLDAPKINSNNTQHNQSCASQPRPNPKKSRHKQPHKQQQPQLKPEDCTLTDRMPSAYDEEYLKKYRPETEDFLTFICFRITASNQHNRLKTENTADTATGLSTLSSPTSSERNHNNKLSDSLSNDPQIIKQSSSPCKVANNNNVGNNSPNQHSPSNRRRPTRQSPRLASSNKKISETETSNHTAYENSIKYEEDMKKASIALEDMAQELNELDESRNESMRHSTDSPSKLSSSPFKNNKHLVKGLMTREFAGAFADEEIIFESITNHKL